MAKFDKIAKFNLAKINPNKVIHFDPQKSVNKQLQQLNRDQTYRKKDLRKFLLIIFWNDFLDVYITKYLTVLLKK